MPRIPTGNNRSFFEKNKSLCLIAGTTVLTILGVTAVQSLTSEGPFCYRPLKKVDLNHRSNSCVGVEWTASLRMNELRTEMSGAIRADRDFDIGKRGHKIASNDEEVLSTDVGELLGAEGKLGDYYNLEILESDSNRFLYAATPKSPKVKGHLFFLIRNDNGFSSDICSAKEAGKSAERPIEKDSEFFCKP